MRSTALHFEDVEGGVHWYAFVFATQSPQRIHLLRLQPVQKKDSLPQMSECLNPPCDFQFEYKDMDFVTDRQLPFGASGHPWVLPMLAFRGNQMAESHAYLIPFVHYIDPTDQQDGREETRSEPLSKRTRLAPEDELVSQHPWLAKYVDPERTAASAAGAQATSSSAPGQASRSHPQDLDDDAYQVVFDELEQRRRQWETDQLPRPQHFKTSMLGGAWTKKNTGRVADSIKAAASGTLANEFCARYHLPKQASFAIQKFTEQQATSLALYWCARLEHFMELWMADPSEGFQFSEDHIASFPHDDVVQAVFGDIQLSPATKLRLAELQTITP